MATEDEIKELAYIIWEQEGCPEGQDKDHYFRAKQILEIREGNRALVSPPSDIANVIQTINTRTERIERQLQKGDAIAQYYWVYSLAVTFTTLGASVFLGLKRDWWSAVVIFSLGLIIMIASPFVYAWRVRRIEKQ